VEVLIAAVVMATGLFAMAQLQVIAVRVNDQNRCVTEATFLAMDQLEYLRALHFDAPSDYHDPDNYPLADDGHRDDLADISGTPDHVHPDYPIDETGYPIDSTQAKYGMSWNIADGRPLVGSGNAKTVAVTVTWHSGHRKTRKHLTFRTIITDF
jgi:hypothetical protein